MKPESTHNPIGGLGVKTPPSAPPPSKIAVVYIAGPFRAPTPLLVRRNILEAEDLGFEVAKLGAMPLIPHTNTGSFDSALAQAFLIEGTLELMRRCDAVVFTFDWQRSTGARGEMAEALRLGLPVFVGMVGLREWLAERGGK